jgi:PIN domain nuclease of toxin-antitoxin system
MTWVLDASAVICWLRAEVGGNRVRDVIAGDEPIMMHAINLVEVQYYFLRRSEAALRLAQQHMDAIAIQIVREMDDDLLFSATRLKAHYASYRPRRRFRGCAR